MIPADARAVEGESVTPGVFGHNGDCSEATRMMVDRACEQFFEDRNNGYIDGRTWFLYGVQSRTGPSKWKPYIVKRLRKKQSGVERVEFEAFARRGAKERNWIGCYPTREEAIKAAWELIATLPADQPENK